MKKFITMFFLLQFISFQQLAWAETGFFVVDETDNLNVLLSDDGTGIVRNIGCPICDFNIAKITTKSRASINGKDVDIKEVKARNGQPAMISFSPKTREVQYIRWYTE